MLRCTASERYGLMCVSPGTCNTRVKNTYHLHLCWLLTISQHSFPAARILTSCVLGVTADCNVGSWRHGNGSRRVIGLANQWSPLALLFDRDATLAAYYALSSWKRELESFRARLAVVTSREHAVLHVQCCIHVFACRACAGLQEALLEVVAQKCVENRVHGGVGVAEEPGEQEDGEADDGLANIRRSENEGHLQSGLVIWASVINTLWWHSAP